MKKEYYWLAAIIFIALAVRIFFAFQTPEYSSDNAYYTLRQVEHIHETFLPLFKDELSYGGRTNFLLPLYYYLIAIPSWIFTSPFTPKVITNLLAVTIIGIVYAIVRHLTRNTEAALLSATMTAALPIFMQETMNTLSISAEVIPLLFLGLYALIRIEEGTRWIMVFIITLLIFRLSSTSVIFLIFILWIYKALTSVERMPKIKIENEVILFATVLIIWTLFVGFKKVFLDHGIAILWKAIPDSLLELYFAVLAFPTPFLVIGLLPILLGLYVIVQSLTIDKRRNVYPFISVIIIGILLLVLHIIEPTFGLILIGISLCILSGTAYQHILSVKRSLVRNSLRILIIIAVIGTMIVPTIVEAHKSSRQAYTPQEIDALRWIEENTPEDATIGSSIPDGHLVTAIAHRKNIMDTNFIFAEGTETRLKDLYTIYRSPSQTEMIAAMERYSASYLYISPHSYQEYNSMIPPAIDETCFKTVYKAETVMVIKRECRLETR